MRQGLFNEEGHASVGASAGNLHVLGRAVGDHHRINLTEGQRPIGDPFNTVLPMGTGFGLPPVTEGQYLGAEGDQIVDVSFADGACANDQNFHACSI